MALLAPLADAQTVTLKFHPKVGAAYSFRSSNKMSTTGAGQMSAMGNISQSMAMALKIASANAKGVTVQMKVTEVKFDVPKDSPAASRMESAAASMKGVQIEQVLNAQAKSLSTKVLGGGPSAQQLINQFGTLRAGFLGVEFPSGPVAVGAKWSTRVDFAKVLGSALPGMVRMGKVSSLPLQYTLARVENRSGKRIAVIAFTMKGTMDLAIGGGPASPATGQAPAGMTMKLTLDTRGTFDVDLATGMPLRGTSNGSTKTAISNMNIVQTMSSTFTVK